MKIEKQTVKTPMVVDSFLDKSIGEFLLAKNLERESAHNRSGKLSASRLGDPVQWQVLYALGIPQKPIDEYVVRKFLRGNQVEDWLVERIEPIATQEFVEYRDVVGYIDALVDTSKWEKNYGTIPLEVKSVTNAAFKWIERDGIKHPHALQAGLYALAKGVKHFAVAYVASDDLRVLTIIEQTAKVEAEINGIISKYEDARKKGIIPKFEAVEKWQENLDYAKYPAFMGLSEEECMTKYLEIKSNGGTAN